MDDDGAEVPPGTDGRDHRPGVRARRGYYKEAEATRQTWRDGWLYSGDLGYLDDDGFLWITGRTKDLIIRGGNNIAPGEVEEVLFAHPDVVEAAVAGIPHDVLGEDVGAWVVMQDGSDTTAADLRGLPARATGRLQGAPDAAPRGLAAPQRRRQGREAGARVAEAARSARHRRPGAVR